MDASRFRTRVYKAAQVRSSGSCRGDISNHRLRLCDAPRISRANPLGKMWALWPKPKLLWRAAVCMGAASADGARCR